LALAEHQDRAARIEKWLRVLVMAVAVFLMLLFVITAMERIRYPYELEELEGNMFLGALRVFHGQALYPRPSLEFIPYMYPPAYYYVSAALGRVMGMTIAAPRLVSTLSTLGSFVMIYAIVYRETHQGLAKASRRYLPAIAAAGFYAGCYTLSEGFFDSGRLDPFFLLTVLLAMYATRWLHPVAAALLWTLAFQTKQSILPAAFAMLCCDFGLGRTRRTLSGVVALALGAGGSVLWLNHATGGWYSFYVFTVPGANADILLRPLLMFWPIDMLRPFALPLLMMVAAVVLTRPSWSSRATRFYLAACSLLPLYWWIRTHDGSSTNALMPIYVLLALLFGLALARLLEWLAQIGCTTPQGHGLVRTATLLLLLATLLQLTARIYNPHNDRPTADRRKAMDAVIAAVRSAPGEVYVAQHPYYAWLAGKPTQADLVSLHDAMRPVSPVRDELQAQMRSALAEHRFSAILLDHPGSANRIDRIADDGGAWRADFAVQRYLLPDDLEIRPDWILLHAPSSTAGFSVLATPSEAQGR